MCFFRCTVQECSGTLMWPLSWCWPLKMTDCQSSKCGTSVLPHHPLKFLRTIQGEVLTVSVLLVFCFFFLFFLIIFANIGYTACTICWYFLPGEFCPYLGARLTLSSCWVVLKTTGSSAGIQTLERYVTIIAVLLSVCVIPELLASTWFKDKAMDPHMYNFLCCR